MAWHGNLLLQGHQGLSQGPLELVNTTSSSQASPVPTTRWRTEIGITCLTSQVAIFIFILCFWRERKNKGKSKAPAPLSPQVRYNHCRSLTTFHPSGLTWISHCSEKGLSRHPKVIRLKALCYIFHINYQAFPSGQLSLCRKRILYQVTGIQGKGSSRCYLCCATFHFYFPKASSEIPIYVHTATKLRLSVVGAF